jgi:hypothetical protein
MEEEDGAEAVAMQDDDMVRASVHPRPAVRQ